MYQIQVAKWILIACACLAGIGAAAWLVTKLGFSLGSLPGDIRIDGAGWSFRFPFGTCVVISLVLTLIVNLLLRLLER